MRVFLRAHRLRVQKAHVHMHHLSASPSSCVLCRSRGCMGSPGACTMVLCTRCRPHPNMQPPRLLPSPRLPSTSRRPSGTCTSPTSACQVGAAAGPRGHAESRRAWGAWLSSARSSWFTERACYPPVRLTLTPALRVHWTVLLFFEGEEAEASIGFRHITRMWCLAHVPAGNPVCVQLRACTQGRPGFADRFSIVG